MVRTKELPPEDKRGKGIPVIGARPKFIPIFIVACEKIMTIIPKQRSCPKRDGDLRAITVDLAKINPKRIITTRDPKNPHSSEREAKMKSV